ncbi:MAG TPA: hypothetical protein V6C65_06050 [Allocoleopsis sp.]
MLLKKFRKPFNLRRSLYLPFLKLLLRATYRATEQRAGARV